ncbi:uncharacterized protein ATC70_012474 [Mucor velutinosus]|uniref:Uncharacterized protein n=1 Tax=Mucor velutinosus TaxID=708070 RepID=A0AAN7D7A3_9FUNG|nr:hypothetical protein ATC70_012474 [Mucor velutinosus]
MDLYAANVTGPNVMGFSDPSLVPETALFSFHPLMYLYFTLSFYIVPYPVYRYVAKKYKWEVNQKTIARHWSDTMLGFSYGLIVFIFGNYSKAFSWITVVAFYPSLFGYAIIAEQPYTKTSLPNIKHWPKGMWIVFLIALGIILAFAGIHIYFASQFSLPFVIYYVCGLLIPIFFLVTSVLLIKEVNSNWTRTTYYTWRHQRQLKATTPPSTPSANYLDEAATHENMQGNKDIALTEQIPSQEVAILPPPNPYTNKVRLHIHHWQIFYVLAFFTRFKHPVSQVAAGIVLACYMQGICAYGYDPLVNDDR